MHSTCSRTMVRKNAFYMFSHHGAKTCGVYMFSRHGAKTCRMHVFAPWCQNMSYHIFNYKYLPSLQFVSRSNIFSSSLSIFVLSPFLYCHHFLSLSPFCIVFSTYKYFLLQILSLPLSLTLHFELSSLL